MVEARPTPPPRRCAIGLGCVTFGREIDAAASFAMMDDAMDRGIALFDTASAYSNGVSETIIGQWLKARARPVGTPEVATKIVPPYTADGIRRSIGASLARLGADRIDLLFFHRWDATMLGREAHETLDELMRNGTVRSLGVCNVDDGQLAAVLAERAKTRSPSLAWVQNIHNFAVRGFDDALRQRCQDEGIRMMGYSPLGAGFLTGKHRTGVVRGSRFDVIPGHQTVYFTPEAHARLARLEAISQRSGFTMVELALGWATFQPWISSVLVGGRTTDQLQQILRPGLREAAALMQEQE